MGGLPDNIPGFHVISERVTSDLHHIAKVDRTNSTHIGIGIKNYAQNHQR